MAKYELKRSPTHPGEILREDFLSPLALTQTELARALKTSFRTINEILNGKRSISPDMALRLGRCFGTSPDVWIGLQTEYDLYRARMKSQKTLSGIKPHRSMRAA